LARVDRLTGRANLPVHIGDARQRRVRDRRPGHRVEHRLGLASTEATNEPLMKF